jgi:uncharacterized protein YlxW (UPF0749 family)
MDIAAASLQNNEEVTSLKTENEELRKKVKQLQSSMEVVIRDRDDKEARLKALKSVLG